MSSISLALTGITQAQTQFATSAERLSKAASLDSSAGDSVDLSSDIVSLLGARHAVALSVAVAHAADVATKTILSFFA